MKINYWSCKFSNYLEVWDGEDEHRIYNCTHEKGCGTCSIDNKWNGEKKFCELAETE